MKRHSVILAGVLFLSACGQPAPTEVQPATSAPTAQPGAASPTEPALPTPTERITPTPTDQPVVLPAGRLLLSVGWKPQATNPTSDVPLFEQYRWFDLSDSTTTPHPYLTGEYPIRDMFLVAAISPDGAHLAFLRQTFGPVADNLYGPVSESVLLANPDGSVTTSIGSTLSGGDSVAFVLGCTGGISWSADSRVLAFPVQRNFGISDSELRVYELDSGRLRTLTLGTTQLEEFALGPDGALIAFTAIRSDPEVSLNLYVVNADGSNERLVAQGWVSSNIVWHPDGTRLFVINDRPTPGIYSVDVGTGASTLITAVGDRAICLGLSPDHSLLTYDEDGVMLVSPDGGEPSRLTSGRRGPPMWSPDSQFMAFPRWGKIHILDRFGRETVLEYFEENLEPNGALAWLP